MDSTKTSTQSRTDKWLQIAKAMRKKNRDLEHAAGNQNLGRCESAESSRKAMHKRFKTLTQPKPLPKIANRAAVSR